MNRLKNVQTLACPLLTVTVDRAAVQGMTVAVAVDRYRPPVPGLGVGRLLADLVLARSRESSDGAAVAGTPGSVVVAVTWCVPWPDDLTS